MKKLLVFACMASMVFAGQALAQCNPDPNEVCILFDNTCGNCESGNCLSHLGSAASGYVVLMNGGVNGAFGYEFCLVNEDCSPFAPPAGSSVYVTGYTYPPGAINAATEPCFAVGLANPIGAGSPCITLLTINFLIFSPEPWCFGLVDVGPTASIAGRMAYADGADPGVLIPMVPCTVAEETDCFMACINSAECPPPLAVEDATWGNVKSMYR